MGNYSCPGCKADQNFKRKTTNNEFKCLSCFKEFSIEKLQGSSQMINPSRIDYVEVNLFCPDCQGSLTQDKRTLGIDKSFVCLDCISSFRIEEHQKAPEVIEAEKQRKREIDAFIDKLAELDRK